MSPEDARPRPGGGFGALSVLRAVGRALSALPRPLALLLPVAWMAMIWQLSSRSFGPSEPSFLFSVLSNLMHGPLYGLLALAWAAFLAVRAPAGEGLPRAFELGRAALAVALAVLYGCVDEWHQSFVPGRDSSVLDVVTDLVAALATVTVVRYVLRRGAGERGLWARLAAGVVACVAAALCSSIS